MESLQTFIEIRFPTEPRKCARFFLMKHVLRVCFDPAGLVALESCIDDRCRAYDGVKAAQRCLAIAERELPRGFKLSLEGASVHIEAVRHYDGRYSVLSVEQVLELLNAVRDSVAAGLVCDNPGLSVKAVLSAMQDQDAEVANELQSAIVIEAAAFAASQTVTIREKAVLHAREGVSPLIAFDGTVDEFRKMLKRVSRNDQLLKEEVFSFRTEVLKACCRVVKNDPIRQHDALCHRTELLVAARAIVAACDDNPLLADLFSRPFCEVRSFAERAGLVEFRNAPSVTFYEFGKMLKNPGAVVEAYIRHIGQADPDGAERLVRLARGFFLKNLPWHYCSRLT